MQEGRWSLIWRDMAQTTKVNSNYRTNFRAAYDLYVSNSWWQSIFHIVFLACPFPQHPKVLIQKWLCALKVSSYSSFTLFTKGSSYPWLPYFMIRPGPHVPLFLLRIMISSIYGDRTLKPLVKDSFPNFIRPHRIHVIYFAN